MHDAQIVNGQFLEARGQRTALLQPANAAFYDIAATIALTIVADWTLTSLLTPPIVWWYNGSYPMYLYPVSNALRIICSICTNSPWSSTYSPICSPHLHRLNQLLELPRLMRLAWQQQRSERKPITITQQMQLGSISTARAA